MTDDIVTRLRRHADAGVPSYIKQLDTEAADEIERLRKECQRYADAAGGFAEAGTNATGYTEALYNWMRVVRGE